MNDLKSTTEVIARHQLFEKRKVALLNRVRKLTVSDFHGLKILVEGIEVNGWSNTSDGDLDLAERILELIEPPKASK